MLLNGQWSDAADGATWQVVNPATERPVAGVPYGGAEEATKAIAAAHEALPRWKAMTAYERCAILRDIADALRSRADELAPIMTAECGKPYGRSARRMGRLRRSLRLVRRRGQTRLRSDNPGSQGGQAPALTATASRSCRHDYRLELPCVSAGAQVGRRFGGRLYCRRPAKRADPDERHGAGKCDGGSRYPAGVVNLINGDPQIMGETIMRDPRVRKVSFTGSQRVGQILMRQAADGIKKLGMELGGSAPVLVFADADMSWAAEQGVMAKFRNNGQVCISPTRFYVEQPALEDFLDAVKTETEKLVVGDGMLEGVSNGPMVSRAGRDKVEHFVEDARARNASLITGGRRPNIEQGYFYNPTVLTDVTADMQIGCDEVFGPVMAVSTFSTIDEALQLANDTPYGLAGYVMTKDLSTATRVYEGLEFGIVGVNDMVPATAEAPFGGTKSSGFGREGSQEGLYEYMDQKFVSIGIA